MKQKEMILATPKVNLLNLLKVEAEHQEKDLLLHPE
jgi:hypothetical protein